MKKHRQPILTLLLLALTALFAGCTSGDQKYSSMPQDQPAKWEGQVPGMGQTQGSGLH